ncbi:DUF218 domain protein [Colletotrichum truncatum]|uniref:DUF218 domain protein n=1 Tax=Colletotrichum truncatum TaxID=5467 RepID=A0ACC3YI78_COLTU|nr:duf218 domain protein [Colletotrichum truncatum]XP_036578771.1 duf218 domain protein [Colletotrichum truncatum]KAF6780547.1 duf218 domain protein [Colletotrichum truncatum]KAF6786104.1 duf218 domain protein [Colletotrichum truncatum]
MKKAVDAVNTLSRFLADESITGAKGLNEFFQSLPTSLADDDIQSAQPVDAVVFCASSVLSLADAVFSAFSGSSTPDGTIADKKIALHGRNTILVLCGGIGHSTPFLYEAIAKHPTYNKLASEVEGKPESRVLQMIAERWFGLRALDVGSAGSKLLPGDRDRLLIVVEDKSTNCGANASESRKVLEACGVPSPRSIVVVQDPTMSKRTVATFEKTYSNSPGVKPRVTSWPTFTPEVLVNLAGSAGGGQEDPLAHLEYFKAHQTSTQYSGLWDMRRFVDLLMGEIPRLRDDASGYGPNGKGFLVHVDIPEEVEDAWKHLDGILGKDKRDR